MRPRTFGSVCSGIEAASEAWMPLGWQPRFVSEIESFCCSLLKEKHPTVKNYGDFTTIGPDAGPIDVLVGGTPCQDFSVAGLRAGLAGERGNLTLEFVKLAGRLRPEWLVWENVPGVLSIDGGRAFGAFLGGLAQLGYGFAYRVLDAQYFGVPQRRRRVFVVGCLGDWRRAAAVLFERDCLSGNSPPRREAGQGSTHDLAPSLTSSGRGVERGGDSRGQDPVVAMCLNAKGGGGRIDAESETFVTAFSCKDHGADAGELSPTLRAMEFDGSHPNGGGQVAVAFNARQDPIHSENCTGPLDTDGTTQAIAFNLRGREGGAMPETTDLASLRSASGGSSRTYIGAGQRAVGFQSSQSGFREVKAHATLDSNNGSRRHNGVMQGMAVRRLTPRECERLQGFPDDYTLITHRGKPAADGNRYKALGNSMAVPVMRWIGERIDLVDAMERVA